jgi:hypothetical protein
VGQAVNQIDQATQQNAALVEEMAAAASGLKGQALDLVNAVSVFKLQGGTVVAPQERPTPAPMQRPASLTKPMAPRQLAGNSKPAPKPPAKAPAQTLAKAPSPKLTASPPKATQAATAADDEWETF